MIIGICERSWFAQELSAALLKARPDLQIVIIDSKRLNVDPKVQNDINVLITNRYQLNILPQLSGKLPHLQWVHSNAAGCNELFMPNKLFPTAPTWIFTRTGGYLGALVSEYVLGYVIAHQRNIIHFNECQKKKLWERYPKYVASFKPLSQLKIAIIGTGSLGQEVSRVCKAMRMKTIGVGRSPMVTRKRWINLTNISAAEKLPTALEEVDYVCSVLPCTDQTNNLLGNEMFKACKKKPVFINCGRGNVIKEEDLIQALNEQWISVAVLDCFDEEPLPEQNKLWTTPNVHITPHVSARNIPEESTQLFLDNLDLFLDGKPLKFVVDWAAGY